VGALSEIGFDKSTSERPIFSDYILLHSGIYCSSVLRCLRSLPFARENYPTYCMYRRGGLVTRGGRVDSNWCNQIRVDHPKRLFTVSSHFSVPNFTPSFFFLDGL